MHDAGIGIPAYGNGVSFDQGAVSTVVAQFAEIHSAFPQAAEQPVIAFRSKKQVVLLGRGIGERRLIGQFTGCRIQADYFIEEFAQDFFLCVFPDAPNAHAFQGCIKQRFAQRNFSKTVAQRSNPDIVQIVLKKDVPRPVSHIIRLPEIKLLIF